MCQTRVLVPVLGPVFLSLLLLRLEYKPATASSSVERSSAWAQLCVAIAMPLGEETVAGKDHLAGQGGGRKTGSRHTLVLNVEQSELYVTPSLNRDHDYRATQQLALSRRFAFPEHSGNSPAISKLGFATRRADEQTDEPGAKHLAHLRTNAGQFVTSSRQTPTDKHKRMHNGSASSCSFRTPWPIIL